MNWFMSGSQTWDKGSLSNMGSKVCAFGSLYQTWVRTSKTQIICYGIEELITLQYGNFTFLRERAKDFPQHTSCSNCIADRALRTQIFLDKMRREHLGWATAPQARVGTLLIGVPTPQCCLHAEERTLKAFPKIPCWGNQRGSPWTPHHEDPHRSHWWCHYPSGQTVLSREVNFSSQHTFPSSAQ